MYKAAGRWQMSQYGWIPRNLRGREKHKSRDEDRYGCDDWTEIGQNQADLFFEGNGKPG